MATDTSISTDVTACDGVTGADLNSPAACSLAGACTYVTYTCNPPLLVIRRFMFRDGLRSQVPKKTKTFECFTLDTLAEDRGGCSKSRNKHHNSSGG